MGIKRCKLGKSQQLRLLEYFVLEGTARSAADLALLLDVTAGPDPLEAGKAYRLELPPPRHDALADFRVLVLDEHPLCPTAESAERPSSSISIGATERGQLTSAHKVKKPSERKIAQIAYPTRSGSSPAVICVAATH